LNPDIKSTISVSLSQYHVHAKMTCIQRHRLPLAGSRCVAKYP